ncbi:hypothetical protein ABSA28_00559 [Candidatus Hepatincolaceae symbiont of Richtersius coronifer]
MWQTLKDYIFKPISDVFRNRLLNKYTPQGISLLVAVGVGFGYLKEQDANLIITILSGMKITYGDIWLLVINLGLIYMGYRGIKLILRYSDCYFEEKIINKWKNNNKDIDKSDKLD